MGPKVKHLTCPRRNGADNTEVVHERVKLSTPSCEICGIVEFLEVGTVGIFEESPGEVFDRWICEVCPG